MLLSLLCRMLNRVVLCTLDTAGSERRQQQAMQELDAQIESEKQVLKREAQESRAQVRVPVALVHPLQL